MIRSVEGFDPGFEAEVRQAMAAAGIPAELAVAARHMLDPAGGSGNGSACLHVLWEADEIWMGPPGGEQGCIRCFRLWRLHGWRRAAAERPSARLDAPILPPMGRTWIASLIASVAADVGRPAPPLSGMRCASLSTLTVSDHPYLPHPDCDLCSSSRPAALLDDPAGPIEGYRAERLERLGDEAMPLLLDPRCGLVRKLSRSGRTRFLSITRAELHPFEDPSLLEYGYGRSGRSGDDSVAAALEALERFCGMAPRNRPELVTGSFAQLRARAADPESFVLHSPEQRDEPGFALTPYSPETVYDWVRGHSVRRQGPVLVPLQLAYYDLGPNDRIRGGRFVQEVSNGCAAGSSPVEAALHGLLEAVERDSFLTAWYSCRPLRRVDFEGCHDPFVRALVARIAAEELELDILDLRCGIEAASFAVRIADPSGRLGPFLAFAAGAHLDPAAALRGALAEAVTQFGRHDEEVRRTRRARAAALLADPSQVRRMEDHSAQGWSADVLGKRGFAVSPEPPLRWEELAALPSGPVDLAAVFSRLAASALQHCDDVIVVDQSFPGLPVNCVKVLAPGLLPITFGHRYRRISKARLEKISGRARAPADPTPHMFP